MKLTPKSNKVKKNERERKKVRNNFNNSFPGEINKCKFIVFTSFLLPLKLKQ